MSSAVTTFRLQPDLVSMAFVKLPVVKKLSIYHLVISLWQKSHVRNFPQKSQERWAEMGLHQVPHSLLDCLNHHRLHCPIVVHHRFWTPNLHLVWWI